jgi:hypothetical protein
MTRSGFCAILVILIASQVSIVWSQNIQSTYADLMLPGQWQAAQDLAAANFGVDVFYDSGNGAVVEISQQTGIQKAGDISKFFAGSNSNSRDAAAVMSTAMFPLPRAYTDRASKDLAKGNKPPKMWEVKEGETDPMWFYVSQLFDDYHIKDMGGSSEVSEAYLPVRVVKAEQRPIHGGDALVFEVETDKPAAESVLKHFHMLACCKDQHLRYGWVQFAPGGIASGQGVLSVAFATPADSKLTIEDVLNQVAMAKIKPL